MNIEQVDELTGVKPQIIKNQEKFEAMATEFLSKLTEYKKLEARMKLLDASCKKYMLDNDMKNFSCESGELTVVQSNRLMLDRSLIDDIEQYKVPMKITMMYESAK